MPEHSPIVAPVIVLALWTHVMWAWMYVTRIPAIGRAGMVFDSAAPRGEQMATLPARVRWKADNYNHLMEQPTVFYAVALGLAVLGAGSGVNSLLAWAYVALRVVHSLIQATFNKVEVRFSIFFLSSLVLIALTVNAARVAF
ncbi:MAG TPA: MAPEG family protein [Polyangiaceae bacterium]|nr:MAPEG family protein [Polyangiaceae bacterium]